MDYKSTLHLPKTDFEMKGNLPRKEPVYLEQWKTEKLYEQILEKNQNCPRYVLHDGPPYANGNLHIGHAMNKIIKDFVVRQKNMAGYCSPFMPGWDTHGLPIETAVTKSGVDRKSLAVTDFRALCYEYALKQVANQKEQFIRFGSLGDYENPYLTLNKEFEADQIRVFATMALSGLIYQGLKPVYWSPSSETALAEAEIEYHDREDNSIYVKFEVVDAKGVFTQPASIICWTTMPWTLPGVLGVAVSKDVDYGLYQSNKGNFIVAVDLAEKVFTQLELEVELSATFKGKELELIDTKHPIFLDRICPIVMGDHVTTSDGTGCVTTAPGHGTDDFLCGAQYGFDILVICDDRGIMNSEAREFEGLFFDKANDAIIEKSREQETLLSAGKLMHSYPHDWRTKKPIIFRATDQWFASIDKVKNDLMEAISNVNWTPSWGEMRLGNMMKDRKDWCISRQRVWGVPIPIIYTEQGSPIMDAEVFDNIARLFEEHGSQIWFASEANELLPAGYTHPESPNGQFTKKNDTMDVWFDSGSSHTGALIRNGYGYPADLYLEGSDQYRGWFNSSLIIGVAVHKQSPYRNCLSHGFVLDGSGNKMSKSLGNVIDPQKMINMYGADILRWWVSSVDYQSDVRISEDMMKQVADSYRKVRNILKFILGNLHEFDYENDFVQFDQLELVDQMVLSKLYTINTEVQAHFENFEFLDVYQKINTFIIQDLSAIYCDFTKDILYIDKKRGLRRRQVQSVLFECLTYLTRLLAPILPFTMEEVQQHTPNSSNKSIHLENFMTSPKIDNAAKLEQDYRALKAVRSDVMKALEELRSEKVIGRSLEASVTVYLHEEYAYLKDLLGQQLEQICIVSSLEYSETPVGEALETANVLAKPYNQTVCERCRKLFKQEQMHDETLCNSCFEIIKA